MEKGTTEGEVVGWHHRLNGHEFEQTSGDGEGQGSLACCSPWGRKESDRTEQLSNSKADQLVGERDGRESPNSGTFVVLFTSHLSCWRGAGAAGCEQELPLSWRLQGESVWRVTKPLFCSDVSADPCEASPSLPLHCLSLSNGSCT